MPGYTGEMGSKMPSETLREKLAQKEAQLAAIRHITNAINSAWDLATTLELITRTTTEVMGMDSCSIYLLDKSGQYLILKASTGLAPEAVGKARLRWGEGLTGWAAKEGKPVGVKDAAQDPRFKYLPETKEWHFKSLLAVPLTVQGKVIGAMNVQTTAYHDYTQEEIELLSLIADLAAGAIEKAMLYDNMQRQIEELSTLAEVSRTIISPLYLDEMLKLVVEMAAKIMEAKGCSLMLLDEEGKLVVRAIFGLSQDYITKPPLSRGEGILGEVAVKGQPAIVYDVCQDPRYMYPDMARKEGLVSLLAVPLTVREKIIGVFACYTGKPHHFTEDEVKLFSTLANQTALAIENATLVTNAAVVREMHHRIKNNLQTVAMLLRIQMNEEGATPARKAFREAINRILSIAAVHDVLSRQGFRLVDVLALLERVASMVGENMKVPGREIGITVRGHSFFLPAQPATALALVVNELIQNALEHAFVGMSKGTIAVTVEPGEENFFVEVSDDGVGMPIHRTHQSLGLQIVEALVRDDLKGRLTIEVNKGTRVIVEAPLPHSLGVG
ncbi:MAG TPA: GAF domain-containing protein [Chloroflexi bacterium]|nr:GAF domain-containing protein [Chloroflexota bacterium]